MISPVRQVATSSANNLTDQSSIIKFIEDNWHLPGIGNGSFDATAGSILPMFDFNGRLQPGRCSSIPRPAR